jgi:acyl-CoA synthetase (AMP-forming)/AMP-acid ligase II
MNLARLLIRWGALKPDQPALFFGTSVWATFGQWTARAAAFALAFRNLGLKPGDRVLLFAQNHPRYLEVGRPGGNPGQCPTAPKRGPVDHR